MTSYRDLAARMTDGPDLPDGPLAVPASTPPGPYSEHAVAALVASRDARIRELEAELHRLRGVEAAATDVLMWGEGVLDGPAWRRLREAAER